MKVFICWSGEQSHKLAEILRGWIPGVVQAAQPYFSPDDVSKGARWSREIVAELSEARVGIVCLTPDNLEAPWLMFEAGALARNLDRSRVCPVLFGLGPTDIKGPLVHFQAAPFGKREMRRVVDMINQQLAERALAADVLDSVFEMWWPRLREQVERVISEAPTAENEHRAERDLLEEILSLARSVADRRDRTHLVAPQAIRDLADGVHDLVKLARRTPRSDLHDAIERIVHPTRHIAERLSAPDSDALRLIAKAEYALLPEESESDTSPASNNRRALQQA